MTCAATITHNSYGRRDKGGVGTNEGPRAPERRGPAGTSTEPGCPAATGAGASAGSDAIVFGSVVVTDRARSGLAALPVSVRSATLAARGGVRAGCGGQGTPARELVNGRSGEGITAERRDADTMAADSSLGSPRSPWRAREPPLPGDAELAQAVIARLQPPRWTLEWHLPRWLGRAFGVDPVVVDDLVARQRAGPRRRSGSRTTWSTARSRLRTSRVRPSRRPRSTTRRSDLSPPLRRGPTDLGRDPARDAAVARGNRCERPGGAGPAGRALLGAAASGPAGRTAQDLRVGPVPPRRARSRSARAPRGGRARAGGVGALRRRDRLGGRPRGGPTECVRECSPEDGPGRSLATTFGPRSSWRC